MEIPSTILIREENSEDQTAVFQLLNLAFNQAEEAFLVDRLRNSAAFIPSLSLVAVFENKIVGHLLFTKIKIISDGQQATAALALAPLSVLPEFQKQGIGKQLVEEGLQKATELGYNAVIVLGHEHYYPRFGFLPADQWHIEPPFNVPPQNFMALELVPDVLQRVSGMVEYAPEFNILSPKVTNGVIVETERFILKPLTYDQLVKYVQCDNSLETELNLNKSSRIVSTDLKEAFEQTIFPNVTDKTKNYLYLTIWTAISKTDNKMVGDICMYGEPNAAGGVEIGYGTYDEFRNKGFMTEIVSGMIKWVAIQPIVKSIIASTDKTNTASFKVLEKNGFIKTGETATLFNWKLTIDNGTNI
ncbi:GNAT family N-acetyltransferase [Chitinophaga sp. MM2321]|uniref:GNAT family N-acetyltransferase n=1 Tax=Chitinophaga sp. MM2321 TaxID=3137178 RepID=UPI0032D56EF0